MGFRNVTISLVLTCLVQMARAQDCQKTYSSSWVANDSCCTAASPCGYGRGDCDDHINHSDCAAGLICGENNCNALGLGVEYPNDQWDCCVTPSGGNQQVYTANEHAGINFDDCDAEWSRCSTRSRQSQHFIVYWQKEFGADPTSESIPAEFRFDPDDLLAKAEGYFNLNVGLLNFATLGDSLLDDWKISIFLYYQTEWLAYGAGYDDVVGALWLSPNTIQPAGYGVAHEIGHSFQFQVWVDNRGGSGFRYGFGPNGEGGNGYWEATANWQANKAYPDEIFNYNFDVYKAEYHRHFHHEHFRYQSLFMNYYWTDKYGDAFIGTLWKSTERYEDAIETYMRITDISLDEFYAELYDACTKFVTWDLDELRSRGAVRIGQLGWKETELSAQSFRVHYDRAPDTTGYNVIRLNVPPAGGNARVVSTEFKGIPNAAGFNPVDASRANWRYGYVALLDDATTRVYSPMYEGSSQTVDFAVPDGCTSSCSLWFVVVGAPNTYSRHEWDEDNTNDDQWPYEVSFTNTNLFGRATPGVEPENIEFSYDVTIAQSTGYDGPRVQMSENDKTALANTFGITVAGITNGIESGSILFYAVESNGQLESQTTANGYGHWFDSNGDVVSYGPSARIFSEFDRFGLWFLVGQYPGQVSSGNSFRVRQALVYTYDGASTVQATFTFNVNITASGSGNGVSTSTVVVGAGVAGLGLLGGLGGVALRRRRRKKTSASAKNYGAGTEMPKRDAHPAAQDIDA